tara:strand:- start:2946 stop:4238 length:1293 start_codon:yes stop_codon:yes gene_type:complete
MNFRSFNVTVKKSNGNVTTKYIDAADAAGAQAEAQRYGKPLRVSEVKRGSLWHYWMSLRRSRGFAFQFLGMGKGKNQRLQLEFLQTMSNMLTGYTIGITLSIMIQNFGGMIRDASQRMRQYTIVDQHDPVDALAMLGPKYIPQVTIAIIRSNAKVSSLSQAFREGLEFQREILKIQSSHATAMTMAMFRFIGAMSFVIVSYLYGFALLEEVGYFAMIPETGKAAESVVDLQNYMNWSGVAAIAVSSFWFAVVFTFGALRDIPELACRVEGWILRIPILRGSMLSRVSFLTTYQISKLLSKGVPLLPSLKSVHEELRGENKKKEKQGVLKQDLERVMGLLEKGDPDWVDGFHSFRDVDRALLKSSQSQDEMANVFKAQSDQFLSDYDKSIGSLIKIHDIVAGAFLVVIILILTLLMFLPMVGGFDLVDQAT